MQTAALLSVCLLILLPAVAAAPLAFHAPGEFNADWLGSPQASWVLLVFKNGTAADFSLSFEDVGVTTNETHFYPARIRERNWVVDRQHSNDSRLIEGPLAVLGHFPQGRSGSLFVMADRLKVSLHDARGLLGSKDEGKSLAHFMRVDDVRQDLHRDVGTELGATVVVKANPGPLTQGLRFTLQAGGRTHMEWYDADVTCTKSEVCPDGGGASIVRGPAVPGYEVTSERHYYQLVDADDAEVAAHGTADFVLFGGVPLGLGLAGSVRLPLAAPSQACPDCVLPDNETFAASGNLTFHQMRPGPGGLQTDLAGDLEFARFDEVAVDPSSIFGARTAAIGVVALGAGALFAKVFKSALSALFSRLREEDILENARRRRLYDCVKAHPGIHLREALRQANVPAGAGRHHISKLVQAGLLVEKRHRNSVCLFEKREGLTTCWHALAALRDPDQRLLHTWLLANPGSPQMMVIAAFATSHGWARSATQARLERLARDGLVDHRSRGKFKVYFANAPLAAAMPANVTAAPA